jgi:hypothetical protein
MAMPFYQELLSDVMLPGRESSTFIKLSFVIGNFISNLIAKYKDFNLKNQSPYINAGYFLLPEN